MNSNRSVDTDFDTFVKRQQPSREPLDWAKIRDEWLRHLNELYDQIEAFLAKYIKKGEIKLNYDDITLTEEDIGSYGAREMILKIGRQEIRLTPIGTRLIGIKGRVDVKGPAGRTRFLLVNSEESGPTIKVTVNYSGKAEPRAEEDGPKRIKWAWKIATSPPTIQYIELTPESLFQALMEVANG